MNRLFHFSVIALFAFVMLGSLILIYYQNIDGVWNPAYSFNVDIKNYKTDKTVYHRGEAVSIFTSFCANRDFQSMTTWRLVDDYQIFFAAHPLHTLKKGCVQDKWVVIGVIPDYAVLGTHHLEGVAQNVVNPLKTVYVYFISQNFQVI